MHRRAYRPRSTCSANELEQIDAEGCRGNLRTPSKADCRTGERPGHAMRTPTQERREISVRGIVQGVGFRPFIYALAQRHGLTGLVRNDAEGVHIEAEGSPEELELFLQEMSDKAPPLAVVESVAWRPLAVRKERGFRIEESREGTRRRALISPDVATCGECLAELFDLADRRYRYPFTNCTN